MKKNLVKAESISCRRRRRRLFALAAAIVVLVVVVIRHCQFRHRRSSIVVNTIADFA